MGKDFRHGGDGFDGNFAFHIDGGKNFRKVGIGAHLHPVGKGQFQDLFGHSAMPAGHNAR